MFLDIMLGEESMLRSFPRAVLSNLLQHCTQLVLITYVFGDYWLHVSALQVITRVQ
jgi:hypothetical protein